MMYLFITILIIVIIMQRSICILGDENGHDERPKVIIDTDGGADDAMAILLLLSPHHKSINVMSIITVAGNTGMLNATANVITTLKTINMENKIAVHMGSHSSLMGGTKSDFYYGTDGFGDFYEKPKLRAIQSEFGVTAIIDIVSKNKGEIILICLGPLTNLAKAIRLYPSLLNEIKSLYIMGGNVDTKEKKYIEFNFAYDAEAAKIVFDEINELQKSNTYLIPFSTPLNMLNVTKKWRKEELGKLRSAQIKLLNNAERVTLNNLVSKSTGKLTPYGPMDPSLTLFLLDNEKLSEYSNNDDQVLFMTRNISVTTCPENERGSTNIFHSHETKSVKIITQLNQNRIQQMLFKYLQ